MHPLVTQVTYLHAGSLTIWMKEPNRSTRYSLTLNAGQAVLTEPCTLFQLRNSGPSAAEVLYIASPSYVFEMVGDKVVYDDAVLVAKTWEELEAAKFEVPALRVSPEETKVIRTESLRRLQARKTAAPAGEEAATSV
jgi:hypothetical protein